MIELLKKYKKILIIFSFPYVYMLFVLVAPTQLSVTAPGGLTPVEQAVEIEGIDVIENFNTVYVYSFYPVTAFQSFILANDATMDLRPMTFREQDTTKRDDFMAGQVSKLVSLNSSLISAYELASVIDPAIHIDYEYRGLFIYYRPNRMKDIQIGDVVVSINNVSYEGQSHEDFLSLAYQVPVVLSIKRNNEVFNVEYNRLEEEPWMIFYPNYHITNASPTFSLPGLEGVIGGPSGGMMQTLSIYSSLLKLNIGDLKIAGTGTIEMNGNIGRIGGIQQKIYTSIYNKVDVFFMPKSHLSEISNINYPFIIIAVDTIEEAVLRLNDLVNQ